MGWKVGATVLARVPSFPWWPAEIVSYNAEETLYEVQFSFDLEPTTYELPPERLRSFNAVHKIWASASVGSLVWSRSTGGPWWPGVFEKVMPDTSQIQVIYHAKDGSHTHSFIDRKSVIPWFSFDYDSIARKSNVRIKQCDAIRDAQNRLRTLMECVARAAEAPTRSSAVILRQTQSALAELAESVTELESIVPSPKRHRAASPTIFRLPGPLPIVLNQPHDNNNNNNEDSLHSGRVLLMTRAEFQRGNRQ